MCADPAQPGHCEERSDAAISKGFYSEKHCPEIVTASSKPRNDREWRVAADTSYTRMEFT